VIVPLVTELEVGPAGTPGGAAQALTGVVRTSLVSFDEAAGGCVFWGESWVAVGE